MSDVKAENANVVAREWFARSLEYFKHAIDRKKISRQRDVLYNSLQGQLITDSDGNVQRALITFLKYGRYVDMGVGRGKPLGSQRNVIDVYLDKSGKNSHARRAKKWYSPTLAGRIKTLQEIMSARFGHEAVSLIETEVTKTVNAKI